MAKRTRKSVAPVAPVVTLLVEQSTPPAEQQAAAAEQPAAEQPAAEQQPAAVAAKPKHVVANMTRHLNSYLPARKVLAVVPAAQVSFAWLQYAEAHGVD